MKSFKRLLINKSIHKIPSFHTISYFLTKLNDKKVIRINGKDSYEYIQGLVTNDLRHLQPTIETSVTLDCIHSFMLNLLGRVVTDLFIYNSHYSEDKELFLEIDGKLLESIAKFLKSYRVRRKVMIDIENNVQVWALFPNQFEEVVEQTDNSFKGFKDENIIIVRDPRLKELGFRLLYKSLDYNNNEIEEKIKSLLTSKNIEFSETDLNNYRQYRYRMGVGEGVIDFPTESCYPLECNADYLHGVSFHKGCYVGQELTARIYHTGVIRKRLMPIEIVSDCHDLQSIEVQNVFADGDKNVGKFRSNSGIYGLSLLKFEEVIKANKLTLSESGLTIKTWKPFWWPKEFTRHSLPIGRESH